MTDDDRHLAEALKERLAPVGGAHILRVVVYGSRARGEPEPESDLDVAVIVDKRTPELEAALDDAAYALMWERNFAPIISLKIFAADGFDEALREGYSFYRNVAQEGVTL